MRGRVPREICRRVVHRALAVIAQGVTLNQIRRAATVLGGLTIAAARAKRVFATPCGAADVAVVLAAGGLSCLTLVALDFLGWWF